MEPKNTCYDVHIFKKNLKKDFNIVVNFSRIQLKICIYILFNNLRQGIKAFAMPNDHNSFLWSLVLFALTLLVWQSYTLFYMDVLCVLFGT